MNLWTWRGLVHSFAGSVRSTSQPIEQATELQRPLEQSERGTCGEALLRSIEFKA